MRTAPRWRTGRRSPNPIRRQRIERSYTNTSASVPPRADAQHSPHLSRDQLERIIRAQQDTIAALTDQLTDTKHRIDEAYRDGFGDGEWAGRLIGAEEAESDMARHWAELSRKVRAGAERWTPYAERRRRELEWAKPRPGDFTGALSEAEYFGSERAA